MGVPGSNCQRRLEDAFASAVLGADAKATTLDASGMSPRKPRPGQKHVGRVLSFLSAALARSKEEPRKDAKLLCQELAEWKCLPDHVAIAERVLLPEEPARGFLQEAQTGRYLTVAEPAVAQAWTMQDCDLENTLSTLMVSDPSSAVRCITTERPASLLVCHQKAVPVSPSAARDKDVVTREAVTLGFEHEGVPAFQKFISGPRLWHQGLLGRGFTRELRCDAPAFGRREEFCWYNDGCMQHVASGLWLYVDPDDTTEVLLHASKKSVWKVVPAC